MIDYKNGDLIITNHNKNKILKQLSKEKKLVNLKFKTVKQFKSLLLGSYDDKAIYYLVKKYNYKYSVAKLLLDNFYFNKKLKQELEENNLIIKEKTNYNRIIIDNYIKLDPFILDMIKDKEIIYKKNSQNDYKHKVYEFNTIEEEVNFICIEISKLLKKTNINKIKLVNVTSEYKIVLKRMFAFYNIPINLKIDKDIYGTSQVQDFIKNLKTTKNIEESLNNIEDGEIKNTIISVCNKYINFPDFEVVLYCIIENLKNYKIKEKAKNNAIKIINIDEIDDDYYFILGFNQGVLPHIYKDEDYLSDSEKSNLGIFTSIEKNKFEKEKIIEILKNNKNITLTYKLKSTFDNFYKSNLIEELNLEIIKPTIDEFNYSNKYNKYLLTKKLDNLIKYNEKDYVLELLYSNYKDMPYLKYDNKYTKIDNNLLYKYLDNKLLLSYSSVDSYFRCSFRYYLSSILKIDKYDNTFMTFIGNLFHYILSICFKDNFDFEITFNDYLKENEFNNQEKFFIDKLKNDLKYIIKLIKRQDTYSSLNNTLYEQKIFVNKDSNIKVTFMGIIDKLKYEKINNKTIVAIIDYKTGNPSINIDNTIYGIEMQLPIYLYLSNNSNLENVEFAGFYLQKIINGNINYKKNIDYEKELDKLYRLEGFSNSDINLLNKIDSNYINSNVIKGMKVSSNGFYAYSKVLNNDQIKKLIDIVDTKIEEARDNILNSNFDINPKKIGNNLKGCEFCKFKDICFKKEEDVVNLDEASYLDFLGGE